MASSPIPARGQGGQIRSLAKKTMSAKTMIAIAPCPTAQASERRNGKSAARGRTRTNQDQKGSAWDFGSAINDYYFMDRHVRDLDRVDGRQNGRDMNGSEAAVDALDRADHETARNAKSRAGRDDVSPETMGACCGPRSAKRPGFFALSHAFASGWSLTMAIALRGSVASRTVDAEGGVRPCRPACRPARRRRANDPAFRAAIDDDRARGRVRIGADHDRGTRRRHCSF